MAKSPVSRMASDLRPALSRLHRHPQQASHRRELPELPQPKAPRTWVPKFVIQILTLLSAFVYRSALRDLTAKYTFTNPSVAAMCAPGVGQENYECATALLGAAAWDFANQLAWPRKATEFAVVSATTSPVPEVLEASSTSSGNDLTSDITNIDTTSDSTKDITSDTTKNNTTDNDTAIKVSSSYKSSSGSSSGIPNNGNDNGSNDNHSNDNNNNKKKEKQKEKGEMVNKKKDPCAVRPELGWPPGSRCFMWYPGH
jgi:hypothetical protein